MAKGQQVDVDYVVTFCEEAADRHKVKAAYEDQEAYRSVKDRRKRDEHLSKSAMADEIANHFRNPPADRVRTSAEVEAIARGIDPDIFARHDAMAQRLIAGGSDESYAFQVAETTYGDRLSAARAKALATVGSDHVGDFSAGVAAVIAWHERRAVEADHSEAVEALPQRKAKYQSRAQRHRLYARQIAQEFDGTMHRQANLIGRQRDPAQHDLPFAKSPTGVEDDAVPLAVQSAFLAKGEVFDDEGHA